MNMEALQNSDIQEDGDCTKLVLLVENTKDCSEELRSEIKEEIIRDEKEVKIEDDFPYHSLKMDEEILVSQNRKSEFLKTDFQNLNYEKRKEFFKESLASDQDKDTCLYRKGDLVWVNVKGSPLWPAMITIPRNETSYTKFRLKKSTKEPVGPRQYHVQFFCDNYRTMWVSCKTIFIYEGLENLKSYCEKLKLYVKSCKKANLSAERNLLKAFSKLSSRTNSSKMNSKSLQWNQAILEADQVLPLERCEIIPKFEAPSMNEIRENNLYKNSVFEENDVKPLISSIDLGLVSPSSPSSKGKRKSIFSTCDSSDEFSGFEDDYSMERSKPKRCNSLKRLNERSEEDLIDSDLDIKQEIEIKEEPLELGDEYLCHESESMTHQKQTSGNFHEGFSSLKSIGEESVKTEVDNKDNIEDEDMEIKTEIFNDAEDAHELKIEMQGRYIGDENLESKVESNIVNHDSHVDEETLFRPLENSEFPKIVQGSNLETEKVESLEENVEFRKSHSNYEWKMKRWLNGTDGLQIKNSGSDSKEEHEALSSVSNAVNKLSLNNLDSTMIDNQLTASNLEDYIFNEVDEQLNKHCKIFENGILIEERNKLHRLHSKKFLFTNTMENNSFYDSDSGKSENIGSSSASGYIPPSASKRIPPSSASSAGSEEIPIQWKILDKNLRPTPESDTLRNLRKKNEAHEPVPGVSSQPSSESSIIISTDGLKKQACLFCEKLVSRMCRHYLAQHRTEKEVIEILSYPIKNHQRKVKLEKLRLEGNFKHNINVLKKGVGTLFVVRRSKLKKQKRTQDYIPCSKCLGFFNKRVLWKHFKVCKYGKSVTKAENVVQLGYSIIAQHVNHDCGEFGKAFARMRQDEISKAARDDDLINKFCVDLEKKRKHHKDVCNKARELGRFLLKLREMFGADRDLKSFLKPSEFDCLIRAARELSYSSNSDDKKPYMLGIKIGQTLKKCCSIVKIIAMKNNETELRSNIEEVETLLSDNWSTEISIPLRIELEEFRVKKLEEMPLTDDLIMLSKHLTGQVNSLTQKLEKDTSLEVWRELATCTLANLILYNKRREGEVAKTLLRDFVERPCWQDINIKEITQSLSKMEQDMQSKLDLMKIRGKRGRRVTILITVPMKLALEILTKTRDEVGILKENPYFFANSKLEYLRGWDSLAYSMKKCNVKRPDLITSWRLRKYVATVSQIMNMKDHEMEWLANHLGHEINIHRKYYRLQDETIELTKVSKFLMAIDQGKAYKVSGKSLDEINDEIDLHDLINEANKYDDEGQIMDIKEASDNVMDVEEASDNVMGVEKASDNEEKQKEINDVQKKKNELQKEKEGEMKVGKYQPKILNKSMETKKRIQKRQNWDEDIKKIALQYFKKNIKNKTPPRQLECLAFLNEYEVKNRTWKDVKYMIYNSYNIIKK